MEQPLRPGLVLFGASVRAAAFSALRAGFAPWCADLFGDLDLAQRCPCTIVPSAAYPRAFAELLFDAPPGAVVFTGAMENASSALLDRIGKLRTVWGNSARVIRQVRNPLRIRAILAGVGLPVPQCRTTTATPRQGRWLLKPRAGAAGVGIRFWDDRPPRRPARFYLQEFIEGESGSAVFVGTRLLGVTRQLIGQDWLHAVPFRYCGSVGPWPIPAEARMTLRRIGQTLVKELGLRGLFGVDFVLRESVPWLVEVNPRYPASVEVLEHATGVSALTLHARAFQRCRLRARLAGHTGGRVIGKAIFYAPRTRAVPAIGPWMKTLDEVLPVEELPAFADIPPAGQVIEAGHPVLTYFARGDDEAQVLTRLRATAAVLDGVWAGKGGGVG